MWAVPSRTNFCRVGLAPRYFGQRFFSTEGADELGQSSKLRIFNRDLKRKQRDRAAWLMRPKDSLVDTVAENLLDRLEDCSRTFSNALCIGGSLGAIRRLLCGRGGIEKLIMMDTSKDMLESCQDYEKSIPDENLETTYR